MEESVTRWLAHMDAAEFLMESAHPLDPGAMHRVGQAIDLLLTHEHTLDEAQRITARERLWLRDRSDLPPAEQRTNWGRCCCRHCIFVRRGGVVLPPTASSVPIVAPVPVASAPPSQGELFSC